MRITVLTYVEAGEKATDYDPVVMQVVRALRRQGHQVAILGVHADVKRVLAGLKRRPTRTPRRRPQRRWTSTFSRREAKWPRRRKTCRPPRPIWPDG